MTLSIVCLYNNSNFENLLAKYALYAIIFKDPYFKLFTILLVVFKQIYIMQ